jgi:hypothetical protein
MQTINTVQQIRDIFNVVQEISNQRLSFCLLAARRTLRNWTGPEAFDDALIDEPTNAERADALKSSEANLAMYHLLLNTGARIRPFGVVVNEQDAASPVSDGSIQQYLPPTELQQLRKQFFDTAAELAEPYRQQNQSRASLTLQMRPAYLKCDVLDNCDTSGDQ